MKRFVAVVVGVTFLGACMSWEPRPLEPERFRTADNAKTVRLELVGGDTLIVRGPLIAHDTLIGLRTKPGAEADSLERVSVPLATIRRLEVQKYDVVGPVVKTGVGVVVIVVLVKAALRCVPWCPGQ